MNSRLWKQKIEKHEIQKILTYFRFVLVSVEEYWFLLEVCDLQMFGCCFQILFYVYLSANIGS